MSKQCTLPQEKKDKVISMLSTGRSRLRTLAFDAIYENNENFNSDFNSIIEDLTSLGLDKESITTIKEEFNKYSEKLKFQKQKEPSLMVPSNSSLLNQDLYDIYLDKTFAFKFMEMSWKNDILKNIFFDRDNKKGSGIVVESSIATSRLIDYQKTLFKNIVNFLYNKGELSNKKLLLFSNNGEVYQQVLKVAENYISSIQESLKETTGNEYIEFFNNVIMLSKFDYLLQEYFSGVIQTKGTLKGILHESSKKYTVETIAKDMSGMSYEDTKRFSSDEMQTNWFKLISQTIPYVDSDHKQLEQYLDGSQIQLNMASLYQDFLNLFYNPKYTEGYIEDDIRFIDLTNNPQETFKVIYRNDFLRKKIEKNDVLRSLFYYLLGDSNTSYSIHLDRLGNITPKLSLFDLFAFEISKARSAEMFLYGENTKKLNLSGTSHEAQMKERLEQHVQNKRSELNKVVFFDDVGNEYDIAEKNEDGKFVVNSQRLSEFLNLRFKNGDGLETYALGRNLNTKETKSLVKQISDLVGFGVFNFIKFKDGKISDAGILDKKNLINIINDTLTGSNTLHESWRYVYNSAKPWEVKAKMQTFDSNKNSIPVVQIPSAIYNDLYFLNKYTKLFDNDNTPESNIFLNPNYKLFSSEGNKNYVNSTAVKVDAKIGHQVKQAQTFTPEENLYVEFKVNFLDQLKDGLMYFQPVAYSDKGRIYLKCINLNNGEGRKKLIQKTNKEIFNLYYKYQNAYYTKLKNLILSNWGKVFDKTFTELTEVNNELVKLTKSELKAKINEALKKEENKGLEIVLERDFSFYQTEVKGEKIKYPALNKTLWRNIEINTNRDNFKKDFKNNLKKFKAKYDSFSFNNKDSEAYINLEEIISDENLSDIGINNGDQLLERYLLFKNMFTEQYLNLTLSMPFIHGAKKGILYKDGVEENFNPLSTDEQIVKNLIDENTSRFDAFGKRMNGFTATVTPYITNNNNGIIRNVNVAVVTDPSAIVHNFDGDLVDDLESTNGSIFVPGFVARLMSNSLPGAGQEGIQKNFTVHIGKGYYTQIKDAQFLINNQAIRDSKQNTIDLKKVLKKMCIGQVIGEDSISYSSELNHYYYDKGQLYALRGITISGNQVQISRIKSDKDGNFIKDENGQNITDNLSFEIKNIYDIWEILGGEYCLSRVYDSSIESESELGKLDFSEASMEAIAKLLGKHKQLQEQLTHILAFTSTTKCGVVNENDADSILKINPEESFNTMSMELALSGIQNDKNEDVDNNEIKEITQLIAALSQGNSVELANGIYYEIGITIKSAFQKLSDSLRAGENSKVIEIVDNLFKTSLKQAERISLAHSIIKMFDEESHLPFSDPNLYPKFTSVLVNHLNHAAIKRKSSGLHAIMTPSENMFEFLEKWDEETQQYISYTMSSVIKLALENVPETETETEKDNDQIVREFIENNFGSILITKDNKTSIDLEDTIEFSNADFENLKELFPDKIVKIVEPKTLKQIYKLLDSGISVYKIQSATKNLRPVRYTWKQTEKDGTTQLKNIWTSEFAPNYLGEGSQFVGKVLFDQKTLSKAFQVHTILLSEGKSLSSDFFENEAVLTQFRTLLENTHSSLLVFNKFKIELNNLIKEYIIDVNDIQYRESEVILPQVHKTIMNPGNASMNEILTKGVAFFEEQISVDTEPVNDAFATISTNNFKFGLININKNQIQSNESDSESDSKKYKDVTYLFNTIQDRNGNVFVIDSKGNRLFQLGDCKIYKKGDNYYLNLNDVNLETLINDLKVVHFSINEKAFNSSITSSFTIQPAQLSKLKGILSQISISLKNYKIGEENLDSVISSLSVSQTSNISKEDIIKLTKNKIKQINQCLTDNYDSHKKNLAQRKFEAWKSLQKLVVARIPGQFRSSFMSCRNMGYTGSNSNSIYCNKFLMWIQGADYDIDVGNIMVFEIESDGTLSTYNNFENVSDFESLDLLPPNKNLYKEELFTEEESSEYSLNILSKINLIIKSTESKVKQIDKILKLLSNEFNQDPEAFMSLQFSTKGLTPDLKNLLEEINRYNIQPIKNRAVRNTILYKILKSTDDISNMAISYKSVDILTRQIKNIAKNKIKDEPRDIKDGTSIFYVQEINNDGKKTVGIYANAIKGFTVLMDYYNNYENAPHLKKDIKLTIQKNSNFETKTYNCSGLANTNSFEPMNGLEYDTCDMLSAMLSLAVDNAKELMLSILNAGQEFAGTYSYLIYLGVPMNDIIDFFTQDIVKEVTKDAKGFVFNNQNSVPNVNSAINEKLSKLQSELDKKLQKISTETEKQRLQTEPINESDSEFDKDIKDLYQKIQILEDLKTVYDSAQELRTFTSILKINQGVTNNEIEMIKIKNNFVKQFRDQFQNKFSDIDLGNTINKQIVDEAVRQGIILNTKSGYVLGDVNFNKFFTDQVYKNAFCDLYELIKDTYNIYDVISKSDIYSSLLSKLSDIDEVAHQASFKYKILSNAQSILLDNQNKLPKNVINRFTKKISDSEYNALEQLADDIVITTWAKDINLSLDRKQVYSIKGQDTTNEYIDLKTASGIKKFKNLMETFIIPVYLQSSIKYSNNPFVNSLIMHYDKFKGTQNYKLKMNLSKIETVSDQIQRNEIEQGFKELENTDCPILNIDGSKIGTWGELLFIYNVLATKNTFGPNKMTAIFDKYILEQSTNNPDGYVAKLQKVYQKFDKTENVEDYLDNIIFTLYNSNGKIKLPDSNNLDQEITLSNSTGDYFSLLDNITLEDEAKKQNILDLIMNYIKSDSIRVYLEC